MHQSGSEEHRSTDEQVESAEQLFSQYGSFIRSIIRFFVRDVEEQEDLYQELFIFFIRKPVPTEVRNIKGFLYRVVADRIKDQKRKQVRYHKRLEKYADMVNPMESSEETGFSAMFRKEQAELVFSFLENYLTVNEATAITLRYKDECDINETARIMNVQPKTVSRYVCVGLKKIRTVFQKMERAHDEEGE